MENLSRIAELAGIGMPINYESFIAETVDVSGITDLADLAQRLQHCKKALALANSLQDPADKKKWKSAAFINIVKVHGALRKLTKAMQDEDPSLGTAG